MHPSDAEDGLVMRRATDISARAWLFLTLALGLAGAAFFIDHPEGRLALAAAAATLGALVLVSLGFAGLERNRRNALLSGPITVAERDPVPVFVTDDDGAIRFANPAAEARFGKSSDTTLARAIGELFANPVSVLRRLGEQAKQHQAAQEDVATRRGHTRVTVYRGVGQHLIWRFDPRPDMPVARSSDSISLPFLTVGRNGTVLFVNDAARRFLGHRPKAIGDVLSTPIASGQEADIDAVGGRRRVRIFELSAQQGRREIYLLPALQSWPDGGAEAALVDLLPVAILRLDGNGSIRIANRLARRLLGPALDCGNLCDAVEGLGRSMRGWLQEVAQDRTASKAEVLRVKRPDRELFLQIALEPLVDADGGGFIAVLHDATEMKTLEAQFVQSQKMQAIGQLAGGVAHDFNNLLTAISGHCDLLLLRHDTSDGDYADLMQIHQNANRAASLVGQLLAFSRKQTLRLEPVDMRDSLSDLTHLLNRLVGEKITLTLSHGQDLPQIRADKRQLEQVVMNLVVNARDAMPDGGEIRIESHHQVLSRDLCRDRAVVAAGNYVVVRVSDQGAGIPEDKRDKIFEPFFTTKKVGEGTGLGLSTAYGIVKQTGGFIFVDSEVGKGTVFTLYFPASSEILPAEVNDLPELPAFVPTAPFHPTPATEPAVLPAPHEGEGVILLVEDEAPVRAFASRALRMRGFTVLEAENAEEALEMLKTNKTNIDVFVTDVVMPGMDGPSWVREALKDSPDTRVVFVSGYAQDNFGDAQAAIPHSVFLPKPFSLTELTTTVREQMDA